MGLPRTWRLYEAQEVLWEPEGQGGGPEALSGSLDRIWGPGGTVLRLPRKSLRGLEGAGVGVMTQVPGLRCFPRTFHIGTLGTPMRLGLHRGFRLARIGGVSRPDPARMPL
ncbi:hypothetical protein F2Q68_00005077 [Brassica cretica]|uniref:Uncharacterized protein n=1 Tax=Brassica cretica TaxID=69181 RepID=A0A8S9JFK7_BRACR|nr:hypothetical protein F2Q68_00005077 [Brassica cretica]